MATLGAASAVLELDRAGSGKHLTLAGFVSWVAWRSAYLTRLGTIRNRLQTAFNWTMTLVFGRDLSRW
jgi:NADH:ubiquinone reductase (non-electrogenic)